MTQHENKHMAQLRAIAVGSEIDRRLGYCILVNHHVHTAVKLRTHGWKLTTQCSPAHLLWESAYLFLSAQVRINHTETTLFAILFGL